MKVSRMALPELRLIEPAVHADARGALIETWRAERYAAAGIAPTPVQDTATWSHHGVLRGLHLQYPALQAKLVTVLDGAVLDVAVDLRRSSPRFGRWDSAVLSRDNHRQLWIPEGFAHGFCVISEAATVLYKLSQGYDPASEVGVAWNDPDLAIAWPVHDPELSDKDRAAPLLRDIDPVRLPRYGGDAA